MQLSSILNHSDPAVEEDAPAVEAARAPTAAVAAAAAPSTADSSHNGHRPDQALRDAADALTALATTSVATVDDGVSSRASPLYTESSGATMEDAKETTEQALAEVPAVVVNGVNQERNDVMVTNTEAESGAQPHAQAEPEIALPAGRPDEATLQAINDAQNQFGTRVRKSNGTIAPDTSSVSPKPESKPTSKKRPKSATARTGSGGRRPAAKKRRLDSPAGSQRHGTPQNARKASKTPTARATPLDTGSEAEEDEELESDPEDTNIYCICRKPDNHTWMIGCDGGCEDWFHGKCVGMVQADEPLLDKFICPNCEKKETAVTTWKPMCRRQGCRQPARLKKGAESKYCSDDCGRRFMRELVSRSGQTGASNSSGTPRRGRRKVAAGADVDESAKIDLGPLGGEIRAHELAALASSTSSLEAFKALGNPDTSAGGADLPTPPASSASPADERKNPIEAQQNFSAVESARLEAIAQRKSQLREQRALLKDREKFVGFVKAHAANKLEKQQCGFDARLSWDEASFSQWRHSQPGQAVFERGSFDDADTENAPCLRKRCQRHAAWQKLALQDVRFEEADVGDEMRRIDGEEREMRQRAAHGRPRGDVESSAGLVEVI